MQANAKVWVAAELQQSMCVCAQRSLDVLPVLPGLLEALNTGYQGLLLLTAAQQ